MNPAKGASHPKGPPSPLPVGLRRGDGVFETMRTYSGVPFLLRAHLLRLLFSAEAIGLTALPSLEWIQGEIRRALPSPGRSPPRKEWVLRLYVFADEGAGSAFRLEVGPLPCLGRQGSSLRVGLSEYPHPGPYLRPPLSTSTVKWIARGPLAHALRQARARGWEEALLADSEGRLIEGTRSNLFVLSKRQVLAPGPKDGALPGITRHLVLRLARQERLRIVERPVKVAELLSASEAFLTSSLLGIAPISEVEGRPIGPGNGAGRVTKRLQALYGAQTRRRPA